MRICYYHKYFEALVTKSEEAGMDWREEYKNNKTKFWAIHYACESFDKKEGSKIVCIAVRNLANGQITGFYDDEEKKMLERYFAFLKEYRDDRFIHWNMRSPDYGFDAIQNRFKILGGKPYEIEKEKTFDLSYKLAEEYGGDYIEHGERGRLAS